MVSTLLLIVAIVFALVLFTRNHLRGADLSAYDTDIPVTFDGPDAAKHAAAVNAYLAQEFTMGESLKAKRKRFDQGGLTREFDCTFQAGVAEHDGLSVPGEWTLVEGADPNKRLLYLHGGAFTVGSPISHRPITYNIAKRTGCAVFAPDYRLMPENKRIDGILDSRASYLWLLENGPSGSATADTMVVAGDSAGGNLTLCLTNWLRDNGHRMPNAVIGLSPATDSSFTSPSIRGNFETDVMLKPLVAPLLKPPQWLLLWGSWKGLGIAPASKTISPVRDKLHDLPPTLIQVSAAEMLYDDAKRYVNKAQAANSPVQMQSWSHMCHVWQIFDEMLPEAGQAFDEMAKFLKENGATAV